MQVTVTGGANHSDAHLKYDANDLAFINAKALAATIDNTYTAATYYPHIPHNPQDYLIVRKGFANNRIDGQGFSAIVDENNGVSSTISGGDAPGGQIILAGDGGLTFNATSGAVTVVAGGGSNRINLGQDTSTTVIYTSSGNDTIHAGAGQSTISAGAGRNSIHLGAGSSLVETSGFDTVTLGVGPDTIDVLKGGSALVRGTGGVITGTGFSLVFSNGDKASTVLGGSGRYDITGGAGGGKFTGGSQGGNSIVGGTGSVTITGGGNGDTLLGGTGSDRIVAGGGNETLGGGGSADIFDLTIHKDAGTGGNGLTDTIKDFGTDDLLKVGDQTAVQFAISSYTIVDGNGTFNLEDGTKVVLVGFDPAHLTQNNFK